MRTAGGPRLRRSRGGLLDRMSGTMTSLWRHVAFNYHEGGIAQVVYKVFWRVAQAMWSEQIWLIYRVELDRYSLQARLPLTSSEMDFQALRRHGYFKVGIFPEGIQSRLDLGSRCTGLFLNGDFVNLAWITSGYLELIPGERVYEDGCKAIFDCYTLPEFRSRGIYTDSLVRLLVQMRSEGAKSCLIAVEEGNLASIKAIERAGFVPLHMRIRQRRFGLKRRIEKDFGPRFGSKADPAPVRRPQT